MQPRLTELCMLARDWKGALPAGGAMCEQKMDGFRGLYLPDHTGKPRLWTRNGREIGGTAHIQHRLAAMERAAGEPMMFDGEFVVEGSLAATKRWCERGHKAGGEAGQLFVFDMLTLAEWHSGGGDRPLIERKARLSELVAATEGGEWEWRAGSRGRDEKRPPVVLIEDNWCFDVADVMREARRVWARGGEGLVIKDAEAPYRRQRSDAWLKIKAANAHKWMRRAA